MSESWVWGPFGRDETLIRAVNDLRMGHMGSTKEALEATRHDYARRSHYSQLFAAALVRGRSDAAQIWANEESHNPDALLLHARVAVKQALLENVIKISARKARFNELAWSACMAAMAAANGDPTPMVVAIEATELGMPFFPGISAQRVEGYAVHGPWRMFDEIRERDPFNREAFHRMYVATGRDPWFLEWAGPQVFGLHPLGAAGEPDATWQAASPLMLLPVMYTWKPLTSQEREQRKQRNYSPDMDTVHAERLYTWLTDKLEVVANQWYRERRKPYVPLSDESLLAFFLWQRERTSTARAVLEAIRPYATFSPWSSLGEKEAVINAACRECWVPRRPLQPT